MEDDAASPGAGRAKLRLSRGFTRCPAFDVAPQNGIGRPIDPIDKEFMGVTSQGEITRKAPINRQRNSWRKTRQAPALVGRSSV
jgi:hypothetical protein